MATFSLIIIVSGFSRTCSAGSTDSVLMVIGGQFFNSTSREHQMVPEVEVLGPTNSCQISPLPSPLYGLTAGRVGDKVLACGGFHYYYRWHCYEYSSRRKSWLLSNVRLANDTGFPAGFSTEGDFYVAGGRRWVGGAEPWQYFSALQLLRNGVWFKLPDLPLPTADACLVVTNYGNKKRLWLIGGSNYPQRYRSSVWTLDLSSLAPSWTPMPDLLDPRMWHTCTDTVIEGQQGILVVGGYYNGVTSMWLPLSDRNGASLETFGPARDKPRWEWLSSITKARKWGPAFGLVGGRLTLAGGGDYGDNSVEQLVDRDWVSNQVTLKFKREFTVGVTVPREWFPECNL